MLEQEMIAASQASRISNQMAEIRMITMKSLVTPTCQKYKEMKSATSPASPTMNSTTKEGEPNDSPNLLNPSSYHHRYQGQKLKNTR